MQAKFKPGADKNECWFCKQINFSSNTICDCKAYLTPTQATDGKLMYRIYSFGCNSAEFDSTPMYHEKLLDRAMEILEDNVLVAVRVGSDSQFAIMIKDADGTVRSCSGTRSTLVQDITTAEFLQISREILESHADKTAGKKSIPT
ncbi:hypothetical protein IQ07DRAFT_656911 [Pyrenochaeta sp. DS3sAY3a]|nr:hypothetical protein IQ07DRAFT_656911 [Pyrenochaeta sp. DS3sAY3a]